MNKTIEILKDHCFFEKEDTNSYFSPGRVNLIGEHTDYNGGHVFPCALDIGTYAIVKKREDNICRFLSVNFLKQGIITFDLKDIVYRTEDNWVNYPKGVIKELQNNGYEITSGFDCVIYGNIPNGSGLSSSASLEVLTGVIVNDLFSLEIDMLDLVKMSKEAENTFVGVNCGIMDQFACGMGKADHAMFLNTATLAYQYIPFKLDGVSIVIANTNKKRGLADSKYNERRNECEKALQFLQQVNTEIKELGDLSIEQFESIKNCIEDPILRKRAKHAVYENQRTIQAVDYLNENNIEAFGKLMNESHISLRDDYAVTGIELDTLAESFWCEDVIGARMTGAGFGGCVVSLVKDDLVEEVISHVSEKYKNKIGYEADFYRVKVSAGAKKL